MIFTSYSNSILATLISYSGSLCLGGAAIALVCGADFFSVFKIAAIGGLLLFVAKKYSEWKEERKAREEK